MEKLYTADDIDIITHDQGSANYDRAGGPVVEVALAGGGVWAFSLEGARQIGKAAARLSPTKDAIPVDGYSPVSNDKIALVNEGKQLEERLLRYIEKVEYRLKGHLDGPGTDPIRDGDPRFLAIGRTQIQLGMMMVNRAVMNPDRVTLPEDSGLDIEIIEAGRPD